MKNFIRCLFLLILTLPTLTGSGSCSTGAQKDFDCSLCSRSKRPKLRGCEGEACFAKNYVFNLTGASPGDAFGDVTAPWYTALALKKQTPGINFIALVDKEAEKTLKKIHGKDLDTLSKEVGVYFYEAKDAKDVPLADVSFELYVTSRASVPFSELAYNNENTIQIIMGVPNFSELRVNGFVFYFKMQGMGVNRAGIVEEPVVERLLKLTAAERQTIAANFFKEPAIKDVILKKNKSGQLFGFIYGIHNEATGDRINQPEAFTGQTATILKELYHRYAQGKPLIIFAPYTKADLLRRLPSEFSDDILEAGEFSSPPLENKTYILAIDKVPALEFGALMSLATIPVVVEGNSSMALAIRLKQRFVNLRCAWNWAQIRGLKEVDASFSTPVYADVYPSEETFKPDFAKYFDKSAAIQFLAAEHLDNKTPNLVTEIHQIIDFAQAINGSQISTDYGRLKNTIHDKIKDEILEYSFIYELVQKGKTGFSELQALGDDFDKRGLDWGMMQGKFIPMTAISYSDSPPQYKHLRKNPCPYFCVD